MISKLTVNTGDDDVSAGVPCFVRGKETITKEQVRSALSCWRLTMWFSYSFVPDICL